MYIKMYYWGTAEKSKQGLIVLHITINIHEMVCFVFKMSMFPQKWKVLMIWFAVFYKC